ncbi:HD domain-containing protein [Nocardia stercoris]|uniref:HD domain-containing protein n=1 Tax=Nocardia stercoris TaxID=2483361 RepID=UPI00131A3AC1|nr:HD domain-containing protein [Nocardia stercoris]
MNQQTPADRTPDNDAGEPNARQFAEIAHGDQRYGDGPYVNHLAAVRAVLADFGFGGDLGQAAWLHDVLEDTPVTRAELESRFGAAVTDLVWAVTGIGSDRKERNLDAYRKIAAHPRAVILKLADRTANAEASPPDSSWMAMYREEHPGFSAKLRPLLAADETVTAMWSRLERRLSLHVREADRAWPEIDRLARSGAHSAALDLLQSAFGVERDEAERVLAERGPGQDRIG